MTIRNELVWSTSRADTFNYCRRKYYYNHYGFWNGWLFEATPDQRELHILKNLYSPPLLLGKIVHDTVQYILTQWSKSVHVDKQKILEMFEKKIKQFVLCSEKEIYKKRPKEGGLVEHEYQLPFGEEEKKSIIESGKTCLQNFLESEFSSMLRSIPTTDWVFCQGFNSFQIEEDTAFAIFDFAYQEDGRIHIVEFKTGKEDLTQKTTQGTAYALYFHIQEGYGSDAISLHVYNLRSNTIYSHSFNDEELQQMKEQIRTELTKMRAPLDDLKSNTASQRNFPKTEEITKCPYCNFRKYCDRQD